MAKALQMALQRYVCEWLNRMPRERDNCEVWSSQPGYRLLWANRKDSWSVCGAKPSVARVAEGTGLRSALS
jgi:hypothetical protein